MRLSTGRIQLNASLKALLLRWEETKPGWNDPVCQSLEEEFVEPLGQHVAATVRAIDRLAQMVDRVYRELES